MKLRRIVERMEVLLSADKRDRRRQVDELKELLRQLRKKEHKLERRLEAADDKDVTDGLKDKLKVVRAQRRKGVEALKALRKR